MGLSDLFYTYKDRGTVEKDGVKYKKFVKVPLVRSKHRRAAAVAVLAVAAAAAAFAVIRRFAETTPAEPVYTEGQ